MHAAAGASAVACSSAGARAPNCAVTAVRATCAVGMAFALPTPVMGRSFKGRATRSPSEAPMCRAAASLPTEAPPRMESAVPSRMPGASAGEMGRSAQISFITVCVVVSSGSFRARYSRRLATAKMGRRYSSQPWAQTRS